MCKGPTSPTLQQHLLQSQLHRRPLQRRHIRNRQQFILRQASPTRPDSFHTYAHVLGNRIGFHPFQHVLENVIYCRCLASTLARWRREQGPYPLLQELVLPMHTKLIQQRQQEQRISRERMGQHNCLLRRRQFFTILAQKLANQVLLVTFL